MGLVEAAQRYEPGLGASFATFARYRIRGAIYDGLRAASRLAVKGDGPAGAARRQIWPRGRSGRGSRASDGPRSRWRTTARPSAVSAAALPAAAEPADFQLEQKRLRARLDQAIAGLPANERHFIDQCYFEGKTVAEAGREIGLSRSWSCRLHARALARLRKHLGCRNR